MRCDLCQGVGLRRTWRMVTGSDGRRRTFRMEPCPRCGGFGEISCCEGKAFDDVAEDAVRAAGRGRRAA